MPIDNVPLAEYIAATVIEDSTVGVKIALDGSDDDSKHLSFIITKLPTKGKLYKATGEPIPYPYSPFQVQPPRKARGKRFLCSDVLLPVPCAGSREFARYVRLCRQECQLLLACWSTCQ